VRRAARTDSNHAAVVKALRAAGCLVQSLAAVGDGVPDLLVASPFTRALHLLEVKDGAKSASRRKLTPDEERFVKEWGAHVSVVLNVDDALTVVGAKKEAA
jgi:hypothetical protein